MWRSMPSYPLVEQMGMNCLEIIEPFVSTHVDFAPATCQKLLAILSDPTKNACPGRVLAAAIDAGECLVKTIYKLRTR